MKLKNILLKNKAILIYFLCSAGAALLETGLLYLFKNTIPALKSNIVLANTMAVIVSGCAHYVLTSKFVFQVKMNLASMTAYLITFFIGLGIQPPTPEWGAMLSTGRQYIRDYPHITAFPGLAIMITIFGLNLFGDGLRDALDPRLKN